MMPLEDDRLHASGPRRALRGTATYAVASIIQRSLGFLLLPLYARILTPAEYGQLGIIVTIAVAVGTVLGLGLETAVVRTWVQLAGKPAERHRFGNTVAGFGLVFPTLIAAVVAGPIALGAEAAFDLPAPGVALGIIGAGLATSVTIVPFAILRAEERLGDYLRLSGLQMVFGTGLPLLFVAGLRWGVTGWMTASALASLIVLAGGVIILRHPWSRDVDLAYLGAALAFGLPMVPHAASHWALALSDRAILGSFLPTQDVGVYHLAYQFGIPISVVSIALSQSIQPLFAEAATVEARRREIARITTHQVMTIGLLVMAIGLFGPAIATVVLPPAYADGATYIPWIAVGAGLFGLYLIPMNAITVMAGRNRWVWLVTVSAAAANVLLNLAFVPRLGALAAAINTAVGYGALLVGVYVYMLRVCRPSLELEGRRILAGILLLGLAWAFVAVVGAQASPALELVIRGAALGIVAVVLVITGLWFAVPGLSMQAGVDR
jgi:O-antigen/teichoic acid export membrane protein